MKYSHFFDVTTDRITIVLLYTVAVLLVVFPVAACVYIYKLLLRDVTKSLVVLLCPLLLLGLLGCSQYLFWVLRRFEFTNEGIIEYGLFNKTLYPWSTIEENGIFSIMIFAHEKATPYFLFIRSSPETVKKLCTHLERCNFLRKDVICIRYSESRNGELEEILHEKTKIYDWDETRSMFIHDPNRPEGSPPLSCSPKRQEEEERWRKKHGKGSVWTR